MEIIRLINQILERRLGLWPAYLVLAFSCYCQLLTCSLKPANQCDSSHCLTWCQFNMLYWPQIHEFMGLRKCRWCPEHTYKTVVSPTVLIVSRWLGTQALMVLTLIHVIILPFLASNDSGCEKELEGQNLSISLFSWLAESITCLSCCVSLLSLK